MLGNERNERLLGVAAVLALASVAACGDDAASNESEGNGGALQCESDGYVAFDSANHEAQDIRLATASDLAALMDEGIAAIGDGKVDDGQAKFVEAKALYENLDDTAELRAKVMLRLDQHVDGDPLQGDRMDATILAWLDFGAQAETAAEATLAAEVVQKTLLEFFFLSVHHELLEGARAKWDEAIGYYGSGVDNDEGEALGLAAIAAARDAKNGTDLRSEIYNAFIDGSCALDTALTEADADVLELADADELRAIAEEIDGKLQLVLAYYVGHEAFEMSELLEAPTPDAEEITIKAAELGTLFLPLERIMLDAGGASAMRAKEIREIVDAMPVDDPKTVDFTDSTWIDDVAEGPARVIELLSEEFDIEIKG